MNSEKRMGRPPLPKGLAREVFTLRLSESERVAIDGAARAARKTVTAWARDVLMREALAFRKESDS